MRNLYKNTGKSQRNRYVMQFLCKVIMCQYVMEEERQKCTAVEAVFQRMPYA